MPKSLLALKLKCPIKVVLGNNDLEEKEDLLNTSEKFECEINNEPFSIVIEGKRFSILHHPELINEK